MHETIVIAKRESAHASIALNQYKFWPGSWGSHRNSSQLDLCVLNSNLDELPLNSNPEFSKAPTDKYLWVSPFTQKTGCNWITRPVSLWLPDVLRYIEPCPCTVEAWPADAVRVSGRTPVQVQDGSLPKGLNEYPAQSPHLGQLRTRVGSKSLVMQDYRQLPRLIMAPEYFGNLWREMSQVATQTFNVLYCFPFIWFNGSHYPRSYI